MIQVLSKSADPINSHSDRVGLFCNGTFLQGGIELERVKLLSHRGKNILLLDLSNCSPEETLAAIPAAKAMISKFPAKSGLVMTDVKGAKYTKDVAEAIKNFTSHNTPYVKASAVVGAEGAAAILLKTVIFISRRELKDFGTRDEAMTWLATAN
jgi:hypothetical protein